MGSNPSRKINTAGTVEVSNSYRLTDRCCQSNSQGLFEGELGEGKDTVKLKQLKLPMFKE